MWFYALQRVPEEDRDVWEAQMKMPLPVPGRPGRITTPTASELEDEMADFASLYAQVNGGAS